MAAGMYQADKMAYAYSTSRDIPWHGMGVKVPRGENTISKLQELAGLNRTVEAMNVFNADGLVIPNFSAITDVNTGNVFGITSAKYVTVPDDEVVQTLRTLNADREELLAETAGTLDNGARAWMMLKVSEGYKVGGVDPVQPYVFASWGHDGKTPIAFMDATTRIVCANTLQIAQREGRVKFNVKHTVNAYARLKEAGKALGMTLDNIEFARQAFERMAQEVAGEELTTKVFEAITPITENNPSELNEQRQKDARFKLWQTLEQSPTVKLADPTSKWGVFNAVTEYMEYFEFRKGMNPDSKNENWAERRVMDNLEGNNSDRRQIAFKLLTAV